MIAVDTSAIAAIAFREPDRDKYLAAIAGAERVLISSGTIIEARVVLFRRGGDGLVEEFDNLLRLPHFEIVPPEPDHTDAAHLAFITYGKGSGHPAQLNFGDLFSYALAKVRGVPLLFKGNDFAKTDLERAAG